MQIKTQHYIITHPPNEMTQNSVSEDVELKLSYAAGRNVKSYNHTGNYALKLNISIP